MSPTPKHSSDKPRSAPPGYDSQGAAEQLWHDLWSTIENDVPTFAVGPYPSYEKVKAFEARIQSELRRAFNAGAGSSRA